jgi:ATP-binding cassette subfamily B protein
MENEILKLSYGFFLEHQMITSGTLFFGIICSAIESIVIPNVVAGTFNSLSNDMIFNPEFRNTLIKLVFSWICIKVSYAILNNFRKKVEPAITQYITLELVKAVFKKYEIESEFINVAVVVTKVTIIKKNLQDLFYIVANVFIPRLIVIVLSCINFYFIEKELGILIFCCLLIQFFIVLSGLNVCVNKSYEEQENKDEVYEYIEDIFYNMTTLQSIPDAFSKELDEIKKLSSISKEKEEASYDCINNKQYQGYITNIIIFCLIIYKIYSMYESRTLPKEKITQSITALTGLFENIYEMTYYIPELTYKLGILKNNEKFLKELNIKSDEILSNDKLDVSTFDIKFDHVSFSYNIDNNYTIFNEYTEIFNEKQVYCIFGPSGSGKSTFIKLIFGIHKPSSGKILINNQNISEYSLLELRKNICYINQNSSTLFNRTIIENIIYGFYSKEELICRKDDIYNIIKNIFDKFSFYDTFKNLDDNKPKWSFLDQQVGKLGSNLSGGQKQIIHLIRIELNQYAKIVILDEPTSALDDVSRNNVIKYIEYLKETGKTIFLITHDIYFQKSNYNKLQFFFNKNPELQK